MPEPTQQPPQSAEGGTGIGAHLKKHWALYTIGIGAATLGVILVSNYNNSSNAANSGVAAASSGIPPANQSDQATMDFNMNNLQQTISAQSNILSQIAQALTPQPASTTGGGTVLPVMPWAKNTPGASNNFWVYTTQAGDTAASLASKANWSNATYFEQYRNNGPILQNLGYDFSHPNTPLPVGTKVNL